MQFIGAFIAIAIAIRSEVAMASYIRLSRSANGGAANIPKNSTQRALS